MTNLNMARTVAAWGRNTAFWAGQCEDQACVLCGEKEDADHIWTCTHLKVQRRTIDEDIAELDPKKLPAAVKQGVAPAMFTGKNKEVTVETEDVKPSVRAALSRASSSSSGEKLWTKAQSLSIQRGSGGGECHHRFSRDYFDAMPLYLHG